MLSSLIIVPLVAVVSAALDINPTFVAVVAILTFWGGLLRIIYAALFESTEPSGKTLEENVLSSAQTLLGKKKEPPALPPNESIPTSAYIPPKQAN